MVTCLASSFASAAVLKFDGHHGQPVTFAVNEEVDVALAYFQKARDVFMMQDFEESWLALNVAALGGQIFQTGVKQGFVRGKEGVGSWRCFRRGKVRCSR